VAAHCKWKKRWQYHFNGKGLLCHRKLESGVENEVPEKAVNEVFESTFPLTGNTMTETFFEYPILFSLYMMFLHAKERKLVS
jgi:hypothetical protein